MLKQASVSDVTSHRISRADGLLVVAMRTYPRQLTKAARDEYQIDLSPSRELFREFKDAERRLGDHDRAFAEVGYERRFALSGSGMIELERLVRAAAARDVYLICQCVVGQRCHRELLLLIARDALEAEAEAPRNAYPAFAARVTAAGSPAGRRPSRYPPDETE